MTEQQDGSIFAILRDQHVRMRELLSEVADTTGVARQQAFDALRTTSQHSHRKLRDVAEEVLFTGELPSTPAGRA